MGSTIYSCTFINKINSENSFHVPENSQYDLIY